jgi:hypothetical protein
MKSTAACVKRLAEPNRSSSTSISSDHFWLIDDLTIVCFPSIHSVVDLDLAETRVRKSANPSMESQRTQHESAIRRWRCGRRLHPAGRFLPEGVKGYHECNCPYVSIRDHSGTTSLSSICDGKSTRPYKNRTGNLRYPSSRSN